MEIRRQSRFVEKEKNLVAEQPGLFISGIGVLIALMVGFSIRGLIQPQRVQNLLIEAASHIHKDIQVKFSSAEVSLSQGGWPRFSIIVQGIQMTSENPCWMRPRLIVDQMELPVKISALWGGADPIQTLRANEVKLTLAEAQRECSEVKLEQKEPGPTKSQTVMLKPKEKAEAEVSTNLEKIEIQKLEIDPIYWPAARTEFENINLVVKSHQPRLLTLKAKINSLKDQQLGDYSAHSQISVDYSEFPEKKAQIRIFGHWREGTFSWLNVYRLDDSFFQSELDLKHIPLSRISLLSDRPDFKKLESIKNIWVSAQAKSQGNVWEFKKTPLEIKNFKIEGDSGDLQVERLYWSQIADPMPSPFLVQINHLSLLAFLKIFSNYKSSPHLGDLGHMTGRFEVESADQMRFLGELSGLQFVFSNKGRREFQVIRHMNLEIARKKDLWTLNVNRLEPDQGVFNGELSATADSHFKKAKIKMIAEDLTVAPQVQKLMTENGQLGSIKSQLDFTFEEGVLNQLQGQISMQDLKVESIQIPKIKMKINTDHEKYFLLNLEAPEMVLDSSFKASPLVSDWFSRMEMDAATGLHFKNFKSALKMKNFSQVSWKNFQFNIDQAQVSGLADWSQSGEIHGQAQVRSKKMNLKYSIEGTRDEPKLKAAH